MCPTRLPSNVTTLPTLPRWLRWLAVAVVAGGIFVASVLTPPSSGVPTLGPFGLVGFDKWLHTFAYAGLAVVLFVALVPQRKPERALLVAIAVAAVYGVGIELVQGPLPERSLDAADAVANTFGALVGGVGGIVARRVLRLAETRPVADEV